MSLTRRRIPHCERIGEQKERHGDMTEAARTPNPYDTRKNPLFGNVPVADPSPPRNRRRRLSFRRLRVVPKMWRALRFWESLRRRPCRNSSDTIRLLPRRIVLTRTVKSRVSVRERPIENRRKRKAVPTLPVRAPAICVRSFFVYCTRSHYISGHDDVDRVVSVLLRFYLVPLYDVGPKIY